MDKDSVEMPQSRFHFNPSSTWTARFPDQENPHLRNTSKSDIDHEILVFKADPLIDECLVVLEDLGNLKPDCGLW